MNHPLPEDSPKVRRRERLRQATQEEIKTAAWAYLAEHGASALSLRGVAQAIGLSAPALYRYFPSKADLITALIVDAFTVLADRLDGAEQETRNTPWREAFRALSGTYRSWAIQQPAAFFLVFGDPIPGYSVPPERIMVSAARTLTAVLRVLSRAHDVGDLRLPIEPPAPPSLALSFQTWSDAVHQVHPDILYWGFLIGTRLQGLMLVELGRQLPPFITDCQELYARETERMIQEISR